MPYIFTKQHYASAVSDMALCVSVCLSVCPSVTNQYISGNISEMVLGRDDAT